MKYIIALDQGTTSSRAIIFNTRQEILGIAQKEITQLYPQEGWVEHDPMEILHSQLDGPKPGALEENDIPPAAIKAVGITNQRETTILWDKNRPAGNQCHRLAVPPECPHL